MPSKSQYLRPRLCTLEKGDNGYGFHLHGEKGKTGQFIRLVEPDSPAETSGLRAGDRLVFVNGEDVENESHQQVVSRIRATVGRLELIVVDPDTEQLLKKHNMKCLQEESTPVPESNGEIHEHVEKKLSINSEKVGRRRERESEQPTQTKMQRRLPLWSFSVNMSSSASFNGKLNNKFQFELFYMFRVFVMIRGADSRWPNGAVAAQLVLARNPEGSEVCTELRPRLCVIQRGSNGYGFNLHSERARPGQYIRAVDEDSPAERAGLQPKDRIVQVNGVSVEGKTHSEVVAAIKVGGNVVRLLVVDPDTDAFFKRCRVAPTSDHITGPLPEPVINGGMEEKVNGRAAKEEQRDSKLSGLNMDTIPALNLSLQQVKELAHQKRSNKRAPPMDWTKKNELFSNL
ncbi:Na(+)/H(+) exchange regulatory cofactor NHE-RF1 [Collichthys lucidus]|uniref:Na(+)/H(+) exchange regulatory cofactor NHE-RF1 n=1 Tax=Collichthys lucidus TaxID=240159 RepID=A0A4U5VTB8_COLLU|nr:Na(+)/H(+) exchange regulatory cofactor NHE-RF1 [Collichthys lucidus]